MGGILGSIFSAVISVVLGVVVSFIKSKFPDTGRAEARAWVIEMLDEVAHGLNSHGMVPFFLRPLENPIEKLFASEIDAALDKVGW